MNLIIGGSMIGLVFLGLYLVVAWAIGWWEALKIFFGAIVAASILVAGIIIIIFG